MFYAGHVLFHFFAETAGGRLLAGRQLFALGEVFAFDSGDAFLQARHFGVSLPLCFDGGIGNLGRGLLRLAAWDETGLQKAQFARAAREAHTL